MEATCLACDAIFVNDLSEEVVESAVTLGNAGVPSWCVCVHETTRQEHTWAMMETCKAAHRGRNDMICLEQVALAIKSFNASVRATTLPQNWSCMAPQVLGHVL